VTVAVPPLIIVSVPTFQYAPGPDVTSAGRSSLGVPALPALPLLAPPLLAPALPLLAPPLLLLAPPLALLAPPLLEPPSEPVCPALALAAPLLPLAAAPPLAGALPALAPLPDPEAPPGLLLAWSEELHATAKPTAQAPKSDSSSLVMISSENERAFCF
jgi:hypothetical protein